MTVKELQQQLMSGKKFSYADMTLLYDERYLGGFAIIEAGMARYVESDYWLLDWQPLEEKTWEPKFLEPVLVRIHGTHKWRYAEFTHKDVDGFWVNGGDGFSQCIPFKNNVHLLGTNLQPLEIYKSI